MTKRQLLAGAGILLAGVLLGVVLVLLFGSSRQAHVAGNESPSIIRPGESSEEGTPIQIGHPDPLPAIALPELLSLNTVFRSVAARVTPTVVFIESEAIASGQGYEFDEIHGFSPRRLRRSMGSGVIITAEGHVVTNAHVIGDAVHLRVLLNDKREYDAEVIGIDQTTDLAVIRLLNATDLPVAAIGDSDELAVGEWVLAVGNPYRLTSTVTAGIISALGRQVDIIDDFYRIEDFIQTDAAINPGNSGGALVNLRGEVIGIATAIATESGNSEGYGFAIPVKLMTRVASDLITHGTVQRGYLGIEIRSVNAADATRFGLDRIAGVVITRVADQGAASQAGIRSEDIVLAVDNDEVDATSHFQSMIAQRRPGDVVRLSVWRRGAIREFDARLIGRDDEAFQAWAPRPATRQRQMPDDAIHQPPYREPDLWGFGFRDLTPDEQQQFGVQQGIYVLYVREGSPAAADGLPVNTVIVEIEGQAARSAAWATEMLERLGRNGQTALIRVRRADGMTAFYDLEPPSTTG